MNRVIMGVTLVTVTLSAGSAMAHPRNGNGSAISASAAGNGQSSEVVCVGLGYAYGAVLAGGRDPDPFVRNALLKEYAAAGAYPGQARPGGRCEGSR
jgi:hypothetical protein